MLGGLAQGAYGKSAIKETIIQQRRYGPGSRQTVNNNGVILATGHRRFI